MNYNLLALLLSSTLFFQACGEGDIDGSINAPLFSSLDTASVYENQLSAITLVASNATISTSTDSNETNSTDSNQTDIITLHDGDITYSINDGDSDDFVLNRNNGIVLFINPPDYETKTAYEFTATATNEKGLKTTQAVTITILDRDENRLDTIPPVFQSYSAASVDENETYAITLKATDNVSVVTYSLDSNKSTSDYASFAVNPKNGEVVFINTPDYETKKSYLFTAIASDASLNKTMQDIIIYISDIDEVYPEFNFISSVNVFENQIEAITLLATDDQNKIIYSISQNDSDSFLVDKDTGVVTFINPPDYETKSLYSFTAKAEDLTGNSVVQSVTIEIDDVDETKPDEQAPNFISASNLSVYEDQYSAITLKASDDMSDITFSISGDDSNSFTVESDTGIVSFRSDNNRLPPAYTADYNEINPYKFTATATDTSINKNKRDQNVSIYILERDYEAPLFISDTNASVDENQTSAITIEATDTMSATLTYSILDGDHSASFNLISTTGEITFQSAPNYDIQSYYKFTVQAMDEQENKKVQIIEIYINNPN